MSTTRRVAIGALVVAAVAGALVLARGGPDERTSIGVYDLTVGDCIASQPAPVAVNVRRVACDDADTAIRFFASVPYPDAAPSWPGEAAVERAAATACRSRLDADDHRSLYVVGPDEQHWSTLDHSILCGVYAPPS